MSLEWRNQGALSNYPFTGGSSLLDVTGRSVLTAGDVVDLVLYPRNVLETGTYLSSLSVSDETVSGSISSAFGVLGTFSGQKQDIPGSCVDIYGQDGTLKGKIVFGGSATSLFSKVLPGVVDFEPESTQILEICVMPPAEGTISAISVNGNLVFGRVRLKEGAGVKFEVEGREKGGRTLRVNAIGAQSDEDCGLIEPIKNLNGVLPNRYGGILVKESAYQSPEENTSLRQIIRVRQAPGGIIVGLAELSAST